MGFEGLLAQWLGLAGIAALIAVLINVGKLAGVVKDGQAQTWSAGLNLAGLIALFVLRIFKPDFDIGIIDEQAAALANAAVVIIGYITQLLSSKLAHLAFKNVPMLGTSFSVEASKAKAFQADIARRN